MRVRPLMFAAVVASVPLALFSTGGATSEPGGGVIPQPQASGPPVITPAVRHDTSRPLREMPTPAPVAREPRQVPLHVPPNLAERHKGFAKRPDPVAQPDFGLSLTPVPSLVVEGQSDDENAEFAGGRVVPPDTNGDVGPDHYVQFINLILSVYDKSGNRTFGPVPGNAIWEGFGGICETNNDGDPIVMHDHLANRWVVSQFAIGTDGHQCVAVSATGDPAGAYHRYDFVVSPGAFNDYPKLGVWPDAYYLSANEFDGGFRGAIAVALERDRMLNGLSARMVKFGPLGCGTECFFSILPADLDGGAPPSGTPNTFVMSFDDETWGSGQNPDGYRLWDFAVNWAVPANSSFTALPQVNAAEFDANLCRFSACVPQPAGELLDTLSQFTMYRGAFRRLGRIDTLVVSHTVDATGSNLAGVRWAELRKISGTWTLAQQGTIAPGDGHHRWMGSAAMDEDGNIAIGYSVASRNLFPAIRYAVHQAGVDALGSVGAEESLHEGTGSQRASFNRWGDYSSMSVDPRDGCTFWYTQEYYANTERFDFKTKIGSFKVPSCR